MDSTSALIAKLVELGATLRPPASEDAINKAQTMVGSEFPAGIVEFYRACDGVQNATSKQIWDFFSLQTLVQRTLERREREYLLVDEDKKVPSRELVCFCDVLIDAPTYVFSARTGQFYGDQGGTGWLVADSYEEFVQVFLSRNDDALLLLV